MLNRLLKILNPSAYKKDDISKPLSLLQKGDTVYLLFVRNKEIRYTIDLYEATEAKSIWVLKATVYGIDRNKDFNDLLQLTPIYEDDENSYRVLGGHGVITPLICFSTKNINKLFGKHAHFQDACFSNYTIHISTSKKKILKQIKNYTKEIQFKYGIITHSKEFSDSLKKSAIKQNKNAREQLAQLKYHLALL